MIVMVVMVMNMVMMQSILLLLCSCHRLTVWSKAKQFINIKIITYRGSVPFSPFELLAAENAAAPVKVAY